MSVLEHELSVLRKCVRALDSLPSPAARMRVARYLSEYAAEVPVREETPLIGPPVMSIESAEPFRPSPEFGAIDPRRFR